MLATAMVVAERPGAVRVGAGTLSDTTALGPELEQSLVDGLAAGVLAPARKAYRGVDMFFRFVRLRRTVSS